MLEGLGSEGGPPLMAVHAWRCCWECSALGAGPCIMIDPHHGSRLRMSWARASDQGVSHDAVSTGKHIAWKLVTNVLYRRGALLPRGRRWSGSHRSRCTGWKGGKKTTLLDSSRTRSNRHKMTYRHISVSCPQSRPGRRPRCVA